MELVYAVAAGVILLLLIELLSGRKQKRDDAELTVITEFIDSTLRGYPDHLKHSIHDTYNWTCHTKLFTIQIQLIPRATQYRFSAYFFSDLPFTLRIKRSMIGQN